MKQILLAIAFVAVMASMLYNPSPRVINVQKISPDEIHLNTDKPEEHDKILASEL